MPTTGQNLLRHRNCGESPQSSARVLNMEQSVDSPGNLALRRLCSSQSPQPSPRAIYGEQSADNKGNLSSRGIGKVDIQFPKLYVQQPRGLTYFGEWYNAMRFNIHNVNGSGQVKSKRTRLRIHLSLLQPNTTSPALRYTHACSESALRISNDPNWKAANTCSREKENVRCDSRNSAGNVHKNVKQEPNCPNKGEMATSVNLGDKSILKGKTTIPCKINIVNIRFKTPTPGKCTAVNKAKERTVRFNRIQSIHSPEIDILVPDSASLKSRHLNLNNSNAYELKYGKLVKLENASVTYTGSGSTHVEVEEHNDYGYKSDLTAGEILSAIDAASYDVIGVQAVTHDGANADPAGSEICTNSVIEKCGMEIANGENHMKVLHQETKETPDHGSCSPAKAESVARNYIADTPTAPSPRGNQQNSQRITTEEINMATYHGVSGDAAAMYEVITNQADEALTTAGDVLRDDSGSEDGPNLLQEELPMSSGGINHHLRLVGHEETASELHQRNDTFALDIGGRWKQLVKSDKADSKTVGRNDMALYDTDGSRPVEVDSSDSVQDKLMQVSEARRKKQLEPPVKFVALPDPRPLTVCFDYTGTRATHNDVYESVKDAIEHIPDARIMSIQFGARNVMLGTMWVDNRWLVSVSTKQCVNVLLGRGITLEKESVKLRRYDDVVKEEYNKFQQHREKAKRKSGRKTKGDATQAQTCHGGKALSLGRLEHSEQGYFHRNELHSSAHTSDRIDQNTF